MQKKWFAFIRMLTLLVVLIFSVQPALKASSQAYLQDQPTSSGSTVSAAAYPTTRNLVTSDIRIRQAVAYCTDRWSLAKAAFPTYTDPQIDELMLDSIFPSTHWAYVQPSTQYPFNPTQGQALLDQAGWLLAPGATYRSDPNGNPLVFKLTLNYSSIRQAWAPVFEQQMLACGIQVLRFHVPGDWWFSPVTGLARRDFEVGAFAWVMDDEPDVNILYGCSSIPSAANGWLGQNYMGWCNAAASAAAAQASDTNLTHEQRLPYFDTLQNLIADEVPTLPLFLYDAAGTTFEHLDFNFDNPPPPSPVLTDLRVRKAIAYCTDREALAEAVYPAYSDPEIDALMLDSFLPSSHWAYTQPTTLYPFNPTTGQALLDQAGWTLAQGATYRSKSGEPLVFKFTTTDSAIRLAWAPVFEQQMLACGIRVLRLHVPSAWWFSTKSGLTRRNFELGAFAWMSEDDPDMVSVYASNKIPSAFNGWNGQNYMGWFNLTATAAAVHASDTNLTHAQRLPYFAILQNEFANDMPSLPLFNYGEGSTAWEHIDFNEFSLNWPVFLPLARK